MIQPNAYSADANALKLFLEAHFTSPDTADIPPNIIIGEVPDDFDLLFLLSDKIEVIGSIVDANGNVDFMLKSDLSIDVVAETYRQQLLKNNWRVRKPSWTRQAGLTHTKNVRASFCRQEHSLILNLLIREWERDCLIRISLQSEASPCLKTPMDQIDYSQAIPVLVAPPVSQVQHITQAGGSSSKRGHYALSTISLKTDVLLPELMIHYVELLEEHGWEITELHQSDSFVHSSWNFDYHYQMWSANFLIARLTSQRDKYRLVIVANNL